MGIRVMIATDGTDESVEAAQRALDYIPVDAEVYLVSIIEGKYDPALDAGGFAGPWPGFSPISPTPPRSCSRARRFPAPCPATATGAGAESGISMSRARYAAMSPPPCANAAGGMRTVS